MFSDSLACVLNFIEEFLLNDITLYPPSNTIESEFNSKSKNSSS